MKINRLLYLGYYLKNQDYSKLNTAINFVSQKYNKSKLLLILSMVKDSLIYNVSLLETLQFGFYKKTDEEKSKWAGTGYMYEYQKIMNPKNERNILDDKTLFYKEYKKYFVHDAMDLDEMTNNIDRVKRMLEMSKVVIKESRGKCGLGTSFLESKNFTPENLIIHMKTKGYDLAETYIEQHPDLQSLSPSGVNTVRIFTQLNYNNEVEILGCRQRISINSPVDNLAAGNIAAPIDEVTGIITGPGVYSDISRPPVEIHPVTKVPIVGFQVPFWKECIQLVKNAALEHIQNRSIGWDVAITSLGPELIEGNHDWCKLVWQLPVQRGLKPILERHLSEYKK